MSRLWVSRFQGYGAPCLSLGVMMFGLGWFRVRDFKVWFCGMLFKTATLVGFRVWFRVWDFGV